MRGVELQYGLKLVVVAGDLVEIDLLFCPLFSMRALERKEKRQAAAAAALPPGQAVAKGGAKQVTLALECLPGLRMGWVSDSLLD